MKKSIIGLDIDEGSVIATELLKEQEKVYLGEYKAASNLKELMGNSFLKTKDVVINLPTQVILFRSFRVSSSFLKSKDKSKDLITFLGHQNLPFKLEECFWDVFVLDSNLNLIAVKKEVMEKYITQIEQLGLRCAQVIPSFIALYNVFIYNYPEKEKDGSAILNVRNSASDLLIYEDKRLWIYPLSIGKTNLQENADTLAKFCTEVQQTLNAHYLQNPSLSQKRLTHLGLCGQMSTLDNLITSLKNTLVEFEITTLESLRKIGFLRRPPETHEQLLNLSLGLGLAYFKLPLCLNINLIKEKIRRELILSYYNLAKKVFLYVGILSLVFLLFLDISLLKNLRTKTASYKNIQLITSSLLPQVKILKGEKEKLENLRDYLEEKLEQQGLYLKVLAEISRSKPKDIQIQEVEVKTTDTKLTVNLSGSAPAYEEVNAFLVNLKENQNIRDAKIFFSSFPTGGQEAITFKLRFEIE